MGRSITKNVSVGQGYSIKLELRDDGRVLVTATGPHDWRRIIAPFFSDDDISWPHRKLHRAVNKAMKFIVDRREEVRKFEEETLPTTEALTEVLNATAELEAELGMI